MNPKECLKSVSFSSLNPEKRKGNFEEKDPEYSGFVIIRLSQKYANYSGDDLIEFCKKHKLSGLIEFLKEVGNIKSSRIIKSSRFKSLVELERKAAQSEFPPLRSLSTYWKLDFREDKGTLEKYIEKLRKIQGVETAYMEYLPSLPTIDPTDDSFAIDQDYLQSAPTGIDAAWAWTQTACEGLGVGFMDLEWGWITNHEDLLAVSPSVIHNDNCYGSGGSFGSDWYNHGTAVLGEVVGTDNSVGIVGIAPSVDYVKMSSFYDAATDWHADTAEAIVAAIGEMNPGDVMLLEIQKDYKPTEIDDADFDAIRLAVANGIIVVEAAGNGNYNLDNWTDTLGNYRLNRSHADFEDSGAIMVGASVSAVSGGAHERWAYSNYGSRIDCYGYGADVVTTGYGDLAGTSDIDNYTQSFGGTSGASPMIVGCSLILQGKYKSVNGTILSPMQMRAILSDPANGTPQGTSVVGNIGVMPNLREIIENVLGLVSDVYLRDNVGDSGIVPSTGSISASPDIIVVPDEVPDPTATYGEGSGNENLNTLGHVVEFGQDNFIYVRMKNRGASNALGVTASVYWSEVATLITPDMWHFIGTTTPVDVPVGDTLVVTDGIRWDHTDIPATGHYCFVGLLNSAQDPAPPIPPAADFEWSDFYNYIRNYNNITWRNFNVYDYIPSSTPSIVPFPFNLTNAPDKRRMYDFQVIRQLPADVELWLEFPMTKKYLFKGLECLERKDDLKENKIQIKLPKQRCICFKSVLLPSKARVQCKFILKSSKSLQKGTYSFGIRQLFEGSPIGGVNWVIKPKIKQRK